VIVAIPEGWMPLAAGTVLVLGGLSLVLWPLINHDGSVVLPARGDRSQREDADAEEASDGAVAALREIEFDRATGKLSDTDYAELKARYTKAALAELRGADAPPPAVVAPALEEIDAGLTPVEAAIRRAKANQKSCVVCGPRPEPDAIYCSSCGRYLPGACGRCGASVDLVGSRFCSSCGEQLAAA
jgi:hypothetical protein